MQKQLADLKSQLNLNNRIENIKKGIVEATKKKGEQSEEVKALQKQLADLKSEDLKKEVLGTGDGKVQQSE